MMPAGYLNLVLHAHLPFVRHTDKDDRLEERWLFEAMLESYIPLLQVFQGLVDDGVDFRITMSLSPTLISMLADTLLQSRFEVHLEKQLQLAESEVERTKVDPDLNSLAMYYLSKYRGMQRFYERCDRNLLSSFAKFMKSGHLELITSAATHAFLPYIQTEEALRAQIHTAVTVFERHFGVCPQGMWLPECAYDTRIDPFLKDVGIRYFFVDNHALSTAAPQPVFGSFSPILTPQGIAAFGRDLESSQQVWSSEEGYPGDYDYREYYRDIGYDLDESYIGPYIHPDGIRVNTGFKYYKITGTDSEKVYYHPDDAREKAAIHAGNFLLNRQHQIQYAHGAIGRRPIVTAPYDAELFGHWWYEGPIFLDMLFRKMHYDQSSIKSITPSEYLDQYEDYPCGDMRFSTWGRNGFGDVWLNGSNDWIYPALHACEVRMVDLAGRFPAATGVRRRVLNQMSRELMLAQSSDWAFIMDSKTTVNYAVSRTKHHVNRFRTLSEMIEDETFDMAWLAEAEEIDNLFPDVDYQLYQRNNSPKLFPSEQQQTCLRVLMLAWEFPPMVVGGLARHVYDLSRSLVLVGCDVHVVTTAIGDYPLYEVIEGVHVHRVQVRQPDGGEFFHFAFQLNLSMIEFCRDQMEQGFRFDVIHAHDWLVCDAAKALKNLSGKPLVCTIHATEHGRNAGISTDLQQRIHQLEWELTYESERVIACSSYMSQEIQHVFSLPSGKIHVLPNGVNRNQLQPKATVSGTSVSSEYLNDGERVVLFIGRLVREKGVHLLLEAAPEILMAFPETRFVIVGKGPSQTELSETARRLGIEAHVSFTGFISDEERNLLLQKADVAVFPSLYEPFGIVALEAMAAKTPIVVADVGGLSDIVDHQHNGLKMLPSDAHSLAAQTKWILCNPSLAEQLVDVAESELSRFDWNTIARRTQDIYYGVFQKSLAELPGELHMQKS